MYAHLLSWNTKNTTNCWKTINNYNKTNKHWNLPKTVPCIHREGRPQWDNRWGTVTIKSVYCSSNKKTTYSCWVAYPQTENNYIGRGLTTGVKVLNPTSGSPAWGSGMGRSYTRASGFKGGVSLQEFHKMKGNNPLLEGVPQDPGGKSSDLGGSWGQTYLLVLKSVLQGPAEGHCRHKDIGCGNVHWFESACKVLFSHQDLAQPNSL